MYKQFCSILLLLSLSSTSILAQDVIVKKDGTTILSKVVEVGSFEIKYKKYSNIDGPMYVVDKNDILSINYENGEKDTFTDYKEVHQSRTEETPNDDCQLEAYTNIPIRNTHYVKAADLNEGDKVSFYVSRDIMGCGSVLIPYGTEVLGTVYKANKSSWFGTKGKLGILIDKITMPNGVDIPLSNGDIYVTGKNRTPLAVCLFLFAAWPCCFIMGSKAELPANYEIIAKVTNPVNFRKEGGVFISKRIVEQYDDAFIKDQETGTAKDDNEKSIAEKDGYPYFAEMIIRTNYYDYTVKAQIVSETNDYIFYKKASKLQGKTYKIKKIYVKNINKQ